MKPSQLRATLAATIAAGLPLLIAGAPGVGKTDIVKSAAADADADCIVMHPVVSDPTDFKGLPWATKDGYATFLPFGELQQLIQAKRKTVCFLDDLGQASPAVQAAAMQLILARHINGHAVSEHVVFIAATNRRNDRAGVSGILEPVKSRFAAIVELAADLNDWASWAIQASVAPEVIAFLRFRPGLLSDFKPTADLTNSPSPRTWAHVSNLLSLQLPPDVLLECVKGAVGEGAGTEFIAFLRVWQSMVSPDAVLASPDTAPIPSEPSAMYALATALAMRVQAESMGRYCRYLERLIADQKAEFGAVSLQTCMAKNPKLANTPGFIKASSGPIGKMLIGS